ncbi:tRNA adenosine(34) deaminase TadA [Streptomyces sp. WMMB303]|uniref:tRNA adenosine(34) deaminase TadA n=1 Tax=Streptomyces sp. WMMB303 TaxID=3034154 RepID=UPI0023EA8ACC|nr:tRNA adenosine(34) deaminase TadA [Streptomyces sp. WMMB303]MDF4251577.1 tRNA adenosine(34) deaminase TadA [Streptomyces sp. WMMB303]
MTPATPAHGDQPTAASPTPGDPVRDPWREPMRLALAEAARAPGNGDVPVGAVVLGPDGTVLGRGHNAREADGDPTAHAELLALRAAARTRGGDWRLTGCTLVVTLEPCTMCAGAAVLSRVDRVVYGAPDAKGGAAGSLWDALRDRRLNHRPEVVNGVLATECATLLTSFFRPTEPTPPTAQGTTPDTDFDPGPSVG